MIFHSIAKNVLFVLSLLFIWSMCVRAQAASGAEPAPVHSARTLSASLPTPDRLPIR